MIFYFLKFIFNIVYQNNFLKKIKNLKFQYQIPYLKSDLELFSKKKKKKKNVKNNMFLENKISNIKVCKN